MEKFYLIIQLFMASDDLNTRSNPIIAVDPVPFIEGYFFEKEEACNQALEQIASAHDYKVMRSSPMYIRSNDGEMGGPASFMYCASGRVNGFNNILE